MDYTNHTDERGLCLLCGYSIDVDDCGHSEDCKWA